MEFLSVTDSLHSFSKSFPKMDIILLFIITIPSPMSKFGVKGMRYDFPKPSNIEVSGNPLRAMNETNIKLAKVLL
jgi:hypothetical protein